MYYYWFGGNSFKLGSVFCFLSILTSCLDVLMKDNLLTNFNILNLLYTDIRPHVLNLKSNQNEQSNRLCYEGKSEINGKKYCSCYTKF
jgi:hypothetical protein